MFLIEKEKEVHEFRILKQFNYFDVVALLLSSECMLKQCICILNLWFMNVGS